MEYNALMRKLPIGIQTFEKLRKENYLYVDKTEFVWKMAFASNPVSYTHLTLPTSDLV